MSPFRILGIILIVGGFMLLWGSFSSLSTITGTQTGPLSTVLPQPTLIGAGVAGIVAMFAGVIIYGQFRGRAR